MDTENVLEEVCHEAFQREEGVKQEETFQSEDSIKQKLASHEHIIKKHLSKPKAVNFLRLCDSDDPSCLCYTEVFDVGR